MRQLAAHRDAWDPPDIVSLLRQIVQSADETGCEDDVVMVSADAVAEAKELLRRLGELEA